MGQAVYKDGSIGPEFTTNSLEEFNKKVTELLSNSEIDHVRIFDKNNPDQNRVGIPEIEDKILEEKIEAMVNEKLDKAIEKREILKEYAKLNTNIK